MKKYSSIEQFRTVIKVVRMHFDFKGKDENGKAIYQHTENYPTLKFRGTVKLHGTNASIVKYSDGRFEFQSRERVLSLDDDNADFMAEMLQKDYQSLFDGIEFTDYIAIYGEWCGGNIQKKVALNKLPKMFVIFGVKVDGEWMDLPPNLAMNASRIYNILQFPSYDVDIDFNNPELIQNKIIELTVAVETSCPVGKQLGIEGTGEGLVFTCATNQHWKFKSKGEKHSVSKVKTLNALDVELMKNITEFVDMAVTENRLEQGLSYFKENNIEIEPKNVGQFLRWIVTDVLKEEGDTLEKSGLDDKKIKNAIVSKARIWYLNLI